MRAALPVDDTIKLMGTTGGIFLRAPRNSGDRALRRAIGVWKWVRRLQLSIRQMYKLLRDCTVRPRPCMGKVDAVFGNSIGLNHGGGDTFT